VSDLFEEPDDATPLEPEEREGLRQSWITHRKDLNEAERDNIAKGAAWARRRRRRGDDLSVQFAGELHRRMFGDVWKWAGEFRRTERNIGIDASRIAEEMAVLFADLRYWVDHATYLPDETAVRLHHRLVAIHPFPNGNGRHARLMADLLVERLGESAFSWGGGSLADAGELRSRYVAALRAADRYNLQPLLGFVRS
jgi:Fic-DOC domain mobile mystery protein B